MFKKRSQSGFTLIELLVVIAIIGLLSTLSILALNQARSRARDAKRISDARQIQIALELYYFENEKYPKADEIELKIKNYLAIFPEAPTPADGSCGAKNDYRYEVDDDYTSYTLTFCLGGKTGEMGPGEVKLLPGGMVNATSSPSGGPVIPD